MAKKINFGTIRNKEMTMLSNYGIASKELDVLTKAYRAEKKKINERIDKILADRKTALDNGMSVDEVTVKFSTTEENTKLNALTEKYNKDKEPITKRIDECLELVPKNIYEAYKLAMEKGELAELTNAINTFLSKLGIATPEKATSKFAQIMAVRISGMRKATAKDKKAGHYVSAKNDREFKELFICAFIEYVVNDKGVVEVDKETGALTLKKFDEEPAA